MRCPQCGTAVSPSASRCPACNRTLGSGVATVTPVPDDATVFLPPGRADSPPAERARAVSSDDGAETRLGDLKSPPTQLGTGTANGVSDEDSFTRLGDDDPSATRLVTPPGTRAPGTGGTSPGLGASESGPLKNGQAFGARYHIIRLLGIGGMGAVYQAWDAELGVVVAIKVIRPEAMADPGAAAEIERRFKRELLLARQVTHKNVVRIHDLGEVGGIKYITMPFVDGDDLATVAKAGRLPIAKVLRIARAVTSGLVAAHAAGVVHRDLKPANIMVDAEDEAMIMDFGIARSTGGAPREATLWQGMPSQIKQSMPAFADATTFGAVVGTVAYMAPEQAKGQSADQRVDIYAFGLILYDLLVGRRRADHAVSSIAELQGRMEKAPPPPRSIEPDIPEAVDRIVTRCIEPDPAKRYQTTVELEAELNRLDAEGKPLPIVRRLTKRMVAAAAALLLAVVGTTYWLAHGPVAPVQRDPLPVLIANFDNRANEPLFEKTLEQALAIGVEGASFLNVYPSRDAERVAARMKPGSTLDETNARLVAVREGIKIVLAGVIERKGSGYAIEVKAVQPDGTVISTATAAVSNKEEVLGAMGPIASKIRRALGDTAPPKPGEMESFTTTSLEAASLFSQARVHSASYRDEEAIRFYKAAIEKDPNFGRAYAGWANGAFRLGRIEESHGAWKKALSLVDRMTEREKYRTLGLYYGTASQNYAQAIDNYKLLVKNYPADGAGHNNLALAYFNTMSFQLALEEEKRALDISPTNLLYQGNYALFAMYTSDFNAASTQAKRVIEQNPSYHPAYLPLAIAAVAGSNSAGAIDAYQKMAKSGAAGASIASLGLADLAIYEGRFAAAVTSLVSGIAEDETRKNKAGMIAKYSALADAYEGDGKTKLAHESATQAIKLAGDGTNAVLAARTLARIGNEREVVAVATNLGAKLQPQSRAYAKILEGEVALRQRKLVEAVEAFRSAQKLADLWLVHFDLGVAYIQAGQYPEALAELELCQKRRGESAAILLDDLPSFRYAATLPYWLGRAKEELGMKPVALDHYKAFLALRPNSPKDPLVIDARKRVATSS